MTTTQALTLAEFLKLPESKPSLEYINGEIIPKSMPKGRHSRLQGKLCAAVNEVAEDTLPVLPEIELILTVNQVFSWLKMGA